MSQVSPHTSASRAPSEAQILRARGLKKTYQLGGEAMLVLRHVDLTLRPGEFVAIEGRSGSGKSTLLHILAGLDAADQGSVDFDGVDIAALAGTVEHRRKLLNRFSPFSNLFAGVLLFTDRADRGLAEIRNRQFGFVFQFYHLLPELNVLENTLMCPMIEHSWLGFQRRRGALEHRAGELLNDLGLGHRLKHRPAQLSGGERQRVAIARALMNNPRILFADEPTGNLDAETGTQIMGLLEKLHREQGQTIVMVTHDRSLARQADRILVLKDGKLERPEETPAPTARIAPTLDYR